MREREKERKKEREAGREIDMYFPTPPHETHFTENDLSFGVRSFFGLFCFCFFSAAFVFLDFSNFLHSWLQAT